MPGDYVKRSDALQAVGDIHPLDYNGQGIVERIKAIPAADVVEVVRCADCKYDERCMFQDFVRDERVEPYNKTVFYCADGKRKGGGQDDV